MARGINKVILVGNLGNDPDVRFTPNGSAVANLSVATSEAWTDKNTGQRQERTEWHRIVTFGKTAEIAQQYLRKGAKVYIEGKLQTRKWQDQSGQDRYTTEVVVDGFNSQLQMLDSRQDAGMPMSNGGGYPQQAAPSPHQPAVQPNQGYAAHQPQQQAPQQPPQRQPMQGNAPQPPQSPQPPMQNSAPPPQPQNQQQPASAGFDDFDDDIPF